MIPVPREAVERPAASSAQFFSSEAALDGATDLLEVVGAGFARLQPFEKELFELLLGVPPLVLADQRPDIVAGLLYAFSATRSWTNSLSASGNEMLSDVVAMAGSLLYAAGP
jgi:hypothetical protein